MVKPRIAEDKAVDLWFFMTTYYTKDQKEIDTHVPIQVGT